MCFFSFVLFVIFHPEEFVNGCGLVVVCVFYAHRFS